MEKVSGETKTFFSNTVWFFMGNLVYSLYQFLIIIIFAKLNGESDIGIMTMATAIVAPIFTFTCLNMRQVLATDAKKEYDINSYLSIRIISVCVGFCLCGLIAVLYGQGFVESIIIILMALARSGESLSDIVHGEFQRRELIKWISGSLIIRGVITLFIVSITYYLSNNNIIIAMLAQAIVWICVFYFRDLSILRRYLKIKIVFNWIEIKRLVWICLPLALTATINILIVNIPRYFIDAYTSKEEVGIYSALSGFVSMGTIITTAIFYVASPRLAKLLVEHRTRDYLKLLVLMEGIVFIVGMMVLSLMYVWGPVIVKVVFNSNIAQHSDLMIVLTLSWMINILLGALGVGVTAARRFVTQLSFEVITLFVVGIFCFFLVPSLGMIGAAWSLVGTYTVKYIVQLPLVWLIIKKNIEERKKLIRE
ncbi:lipopolysaccharide biosynthesis protein [Peribacillus frigoritolerans]|uniref:lipopolysaccharide biosynthesis protein n=1 Tax=Peribacillus frigoritolerans TaxID=450367 RepID=UPI003B8CBF3C